MHRDNLTGMNTPEMESVFESLGEPGYRAKQVRRWLFKRFVSDPQMMTDLPACLRRKLADGSYIRLPRVERELISGSDDTRRYVFALEDGSLVESVFIGEPDRATVCVSSQVGCAIGCRFCASAIGGFVRNLTPAEITGQVVMIGQRTGRRPTNVVYMGMGEPLLNYDAVMKSVRQITSEDGMNIASRHITISTCGIVPRIRRLAGEGLQLVLAVSLHAADDDKRSLIMPVNDRYPLGQLIQACRYYIESTGRRVSFEYALIQGLNDGMDDARALYALIGDLKCHINIIPVNAVPGSVYKQPGTNRMMGFKDALERFGLHVSVRKERGTDIEAACGQLRRRITGDDL